MYLKQEVNHLGGGYGKLLMGLLAGAAALIIALPVPAASALQTSSARRSLLSEPNLLDLPKPSQTPGRQVQRRSLHGTSCYSGKFARRAA